MRNRRMRRRRWRVWRWVSIGEGGRKREEKDKEGGRKREETDGEGEEAEREVMGSKAAVVACRRRRTATWLYAAVGMCGRGQREQDLGSEVAVLGGSHG